MRALVTGAAGFVGRHLCPKLTAAGYDVTPIDIRMVPPPQRTYDVRDMYERYCWLKGGPFDLVVHLAANIVNVDARMRGGMEMFEDIALDLEFCRWLEKNPPKHCAVLMSSCAVDYPDDPYCIVKRNLESFARTLHKKGVPLVVLRPFSGYGEDQSEEYPFRAILERALRKEDPLTVWGGSQVRDWIHIEDLTDAILFAAHLLPPSPDPIEVGTAVGTSIHQLAEKIGSAMGYLPVISRATDKASSSSHRVAGQLPRVLRGYGWQPKISLDEGIRRAVAARMTPVEVS